MILFTTWRNGLIGRAFARGLSAKTFSLISSSRNIGAMPVAFARHLISKDYRPATLHVRDMDALRFSVARFDGQEKNLMDDLKIFTLEDGRVVTC